MTMRWLLLDLETAGLQPEAGIVEIGFLELDENAEVIDQYQTLVDPGTGLISPSAEGIHGISMEMVADAPTISEVFSEQAPGCYGKPLTGDPLVLIGHRIAFDHSFLKGHVPPGTLELCTLRYARQLWPDADDHKLSTLRVALNLRKDAGSAHRVMSDIWVTYDLLHVILDTTKMNLRELTERSQQPFAVTKMAFGKYKGLSPKEVPADYWRWMLRSMEDLDPDLRFTAEHCLKHLNN